VDERTWTMTGDGEYSRRSRLWLIWWIYSLNGGGKLALDQLVFGVLLLVVGVIAVILKRRVYKFYDNMLDSLSPDKPTRGLNKLHKIPYVIFIFFSLIGGILFILWSVYTRFQS
jgi:hypothetical protein